MNTIDFSIIDNTMQKWRVFYLLKMKFLLIVTCSLNGSQRKRHVCKRIFFKKPFQMTSQEVLINLSKFSVKSKVNVYLCEAHHLTRCACCGWLGLHYINNTLSFIPCNYGKCYLWKFPQLIEIFLLQLAAIRDSKTTRESSTAPFGMKACCEHFRAHTQKHYTLIINKTWNEELFPLK